MSQNAPQQPPFRVLLDTNILLRLSDGRSPQHPIALAAVRTLTLEGAALCVSAQNLIEFWSVATRSKNENGLALPSVAAQAELAKHRAAFLFLPDREEIFAG